MKNMPSLVLVAFLSTASFAVAADTPVPKKGANQITISEYMFDPATLNVVAGAKVTWTNHDQVPHTIVDGGQNKMFRSGALDTNDSYSFTFTQPGTYHYFCTLHPKMVGTVNVAAAK